MPDLLRKVTGLTLLLVGGFSLMLTAWIYDYEWTHSSLWHSRGVAWVVLEITLLLSGLWWVFFRAKRLGLYALSGGCAALLLGIMWATGRLP